MLLCATPVGRGAVTTLALAAALLHTLNHAAFKGLLFLAAGSVISRTHVRNMEELGGLARRMPWTAWLFLLGAVAISGLPPLNGFVSEWMTFQALVLGAPPVSEGPGIARGRRRFVVKRLTGASPRPVLPRPSASPSSAGRGRLTPSRPPSHRPR